MADGTPPITTSRTIELPTASVIVRDNGEIALEVSHGSGEWFTKTYECSHVRHVLSKEEGDALRKFFAEIKGWPDA